MRLLLDTHAFIWWDREASKLPGRVYEACQDNKNTLCLSIASVWELQIKMGIGKLRFERPLARIVEEQIANGVEILPVKLPHLWQLTDLPQVHNDPFDRLLIAQAVVEEMHLISADRVFSSYPVKLFW
ncbi:MAG: type II toxin-antitoxin system VapC family toxin [Sulfuricella sp.]|jgi:PIN domain nuclease of toxin-antitoxin system